MGKAISIDEISDGMVLSGDAQTPDGNVLLSAGTSLTGRHKSLLEKRGIKQVLIVEDEGEDAPEPEGDAAIETIRTPEEPASPAGLIACEHLNNVFANVRDDPLMEQLLALAKERAEHIQV